MIQARDTGYCSRSKDKLISNVLLWTPTHGHTSIGLPAKTSIHQLCGGIECCLENEPRGMAGKGELRESMLLVCFHDDEINRCE